MLTTQAWDDDDVSTDDDGIGVDDEFGDDDLSEDGDSDHKGHGGSESTEEALTGTLADGVTAAALAAVPGGAVVRVETDDHGAAYEAHMTDTDSKEVTVSFDESLNVLEVEQGDARHSDDHHGMGASTETPLEGTLADDVTAAAHCGPRWRGRSCRDR